LVAIVLGDHDPPLSGYVFISFGLAFETGQVVGFEVIDEGGSLGVDAERGALTDEPISPFGVFVGVIALDSASPCLDFFRGLGSAVAVEPGENLPVGGTGCDELFDVVGVDLLESEEHLVERTGVMVFSHDASEVGAAFIDHAGHDRVVAEMVARAARWFFCEVF